MFRKKIGKKASRKLFKRHTKSLKINSVPPISRGGIRL